MTAENTPFSPFQNRVFAQLESRGVPDSFHDEDVNLTQQSDGTAYSEAEFFSLIRRYRNLRMFEIAKADLNAGAELGWVLAQLSDLAAFCCEQAFSWAHAVKAVRYGQPRDDSGVKQKIVVLGMGKLGGGELNFSSDIDLILAYTKAGKTDGPKSITSEEFFIQVTKLAIKSLSQVTQDGFVYRVDTRLRPFGDSGALVYHFDQMDSYYETHGREWERYALIKAKPIAGDIQAGMQLLERLQPFVYRRYIDFTVIQSLRDMKAMIDAEVQRKGLKNNIKLGRGGIRSIEFVAQAIQLIRGGQNNELRDVRLLPVLSEIAQAGYLPERAVEELRCAYVFLRRVENRLQAWNDEQTHSLPEGRDQQDWLAQSMGYERYELLLGELQDWQDRVHQHFQQLIANPVGESATNKSDAASLLEADLEEADALELIQRLGFQENVPSQQLVLYRNFRSVGRHARGERSRQTLIGFLATVLSELAKAETIVVIRFLRILIEISGRTVYVTLLMENPSAFRRLLGLCAAGDWIAKEIAAQPASLDVLLEHDLQQVIPTGESLAADLARQLDCHTGELDQQMDALRRVRNAVTLRVAAADVGGQIPLMVVSDYLTELAEHLLRAALKIAWGEGVKRHGLPDGCVESEPGLSIIAFGKLGGMELGYGSDLDLVFLYSGAANDMTNGRRSVSREQFMTRVAQKLIHILSTRTAAGVAYEIDTRLRPSGSSGLLVSRFDAWSDYMSQSAWTWEYQALIRARPVSGDPAVAANFRARRAELLGVSRDIPALAKDVVTMRQKMRANLDKSGPHSLDLKQTQGGLADIEFLVQFYVLSHAKNSPSLLEFPDNIRQLKALAEAQLLPAEEASKLEKIYRKYRRQLHRHHLQTPDELLPPESFSSERAWVSDVWKKRVESVL